MSHPRTSWFEGYRLLALLCLLLAGLSAWLGAMRGFEVEGVRMVLRFTARSSLVLFCLAFSADALVRRWPSAWSRWQRRNRRELGLAFAASHGIHALAIGIFARMDPSGFAGATSPASFVFGGIGYVFIAAMAATSFGPTRSALGPRAWRILHLTGGYYLLLQFTISFGMRVPAMPLHGLFLLPLLAVLALRMTAAAARKPRTLQAG